MPPTPSLQYVAPLLAHRRRRLRRTRWLWRTGILLLGLGLLLGGGWVLHGLAPRAIPPPAAVGPAMVPAPPTSAPVPRVRSIDSPWEPPGVRAAGAPPPHPCQPLAPTHAPCPPDASGESEVPQPSWSAPPPARPPGALAGPPPPERPMRVDPPAPRRAAAACGSSPCPAVPAAHRPPPVPARLTTDRRPTLRAAGPRPSGPPLPPQRPASVYSLPGLGEPERLLVGPTEPEPLLHSP
jgi:hypothetical protein